ncbi:hypothetical protein DVH24_015839 [Malus domestica]|uniref:Uncharacterized protein n=1 Tax=Malus domestica TaxID=3750 RepID=A0A498JJ92_MALDO|nr:hypothetical protein DVH24_015839 [Malus domestica]
MVMPLFSTSSSDSFFLFFFFSLSFYPAPSSNSLHFTLQVIDHYAVCKLETDLCKIAIYGSMLWTLLNLWTSNFSVSSIIYPTSLCMELLHLQSY